MADTDSMVRIILSVRVFKWQLQMGRRWPTDETGRPVWERGPVRLVKWELPPADLSSCPPVEHEEEEGVEVTDYEIVQKHYTRMLRELSDRRW